ncbi:uncharacterized protein O3C94_021670 [Discoglossus pictus]
MDVSRFICRVYIWLLFWIPVNIFFIVMGATFMYNCSGEPMLPIYLVVAGITNLALYVLQLLKYCEKPVLIVQFVVTIFALCWLIAGSVWTFRAFALLDDHCAVGITITALLAVVFHYLIFVMVFFTASLQQDNSLERTEETSRISGTQSNLRYSSITRILIMPSNRAASNQSLPA